MNKIKKKYFENFPFNYSEKNLVFDELCKNLVFIDQDILSVKILKNKKQISLELNKKISKKQKIFIQKKINIIIKSSYSKFSIPKTDVIFDNFAKKSKYNKNPNKILIKNKEVFKEGDGIYSFGDKFTQLINIFDSKINFIAKKLEAKQYNFPSLMSPSLLKKIDYLDNSSQNAGFVTHLNEDLYQINSFKKDIKNKNDIIVSPKKFSKIKAILSPTVCQHLYCMLSNSKVASNFTATASGSCFRYESKNMNFLNRLWNFTMREIIFIGSENYVKNRLTLSQNLTKDLLDDIGLIYKIQTANDPFFGENSGDKLLFQKTFKLKHEVRAKIPYNNSSIAIGSFNNAQDFFAKKLKITNKSSKYIHSACLGFGNERFAYSFVCQYGINIKKWPSAISKLM